MTLIVPFLLLGIGVDDIFVIVQGGAAGFDLEKQIALGKWILHSGQISQSIFEEQKAVHTV